jgi:hypothetical protein
VITIRKIPAFQKGSDIIYRIDDLDDHLPKIEEDILDVLNTSKNDYFSEGCLARKFNLTYGEMRNILFSMADRKLCVCDLLNNEIYASLNFADIDEYQDIRG